MKISLIVAMDKNHLIGKDLSLPWDVPEDLKWFKEKTTGKAVLFGADTATGIGRALPHRENYVLTHYPQRRSIRALQESGFHVAVDFEQVVVDVKARGIDELMICGGGCIYNQFVDQAETIYLTLIHGEHTGNVYMFNSLLKELSSAENVGYYYHNWYLVSKDTTVSATYKTFQRP